MLHHIMLNGLFVELRLVRFDTLTDDSSTKIRPMIIIVTLERAHDHLKNTVSLESVTVTLLERHQELYVVFFPLHCSDDN